MGEGCTRNNIYIYNAVSYRWCTIQPKLFYPEVLIQTLGAHPNALGCRDVNKDLTPKDQDKDKDLTPKDQDKDKDLLDLTPKDKDKDKDLTPKDQDKDKDLKYVLKD